MVDLYVVPPPNSLTEALEGNVQHALALATPHYWDAMALQACIHLYIQYDVDSAALAEQACLLVAG